MFTQRTERKSRLITLVWLSVALCLSTIPALQAQTSPAAKDTLDWRFKETRLIKYWNDAEIVSEDVNVAGGAVEINVSGKALNLCPEGAEQIKVTWRFDKDISGLRIGDTFGGKVEARMISTTPDCKAGLSYRTYAYMINMNAITSSLQPPPEPLADYERFMTKSYERANPHPDSQNFASSVLAVNDYDLRPDHPFACFLIVIDGPGGWMAYMYLYDLGRSVAEINISGNWTIAQGNYTGVLNLSQSGTTLSGKMDWSNHEDATIERGSVINGNIELTLLYSGGLRGVYKATIDSSGKMIGTTTSSSGGVAGWNGTRTQ